MWYKTFLMLINNPNHWKLLISFYIPPMLVTGVTEGTLWSHTCDGAGYAAVRTRATLTLHTITIIPTIPKLEFINMHTQNNLK